MEIFPNEKYSFFFSSDLGRSEELKWRSLWRESKGRHFFNSYEFFTAYCEALRLNRYRVIFCYEGKRLVGVIPLIASTLFGIPVFQCPGKKGNFVDKCMFLVNTNDPDFFLALSKKSLMFGNIFFGEMEKEVAGLFTRTKEAYLFEFASRSRRMRLSRDKSSLSKMSANHRRDFLRKIRRTEDLSFRMHKKRLSSILKKVIEIEGKSYKGWRKATFFRDAEARKLLEALIEKDSGSIRVSILSRKERPIATLVGFVSEGKYAAYYSAFVRDEAYWSAGAAATYFTLEALKKEGVTEVDFLRGETELKRRLAPIEAIQYNLYLSRSMTVLFWWKLMLSLERRAKKVSTLLRSFLGLLEVLDRRSQTEKKTTPRHLPLHENLKTHKTPSF